MLDDKTLVRAFKALSDERRFRMVQEVRALGECSCGVLAEKFDLSQPTISHHMKILVDAGILNVRGNAQQHLVSVNHALLSAVGAGVQQKTQTKKKKSA